MAKAATAALDNAGASAQFLRCVRDKDGVSQVPPAVLGFGHIGDLVYLTKEDAATGQSHVLVNPNRSLVVPKHVLQKLAEEHADLEYDKDDEEEEEDDDNDNDEKKKDAGGQSSSKQQQQHPIIPKALPHETLAPDYEKKIGMIPRSLRDHMPEFYLRPLYRIVEAEKQSGGK